MNTKVVSLFGVFASVGVIHAKNPVIDYRYVADPSLRQFSDGRFYRSSKQKLEEWIPVILQAQEPSGYIDSHGAMQKIKRFSVLSSHEFYVMGYFIEMGVAHYRMTKGKDRRLYAAAIKCALR